MTWPPPGIEGTGQPSGAVLTRRAIRRRRAIRWAAVVTLLALGLVGLTTAVVGVARELLPRQFTAAQRRQIISWEMAGRWRALPSGRIFPATVGYDVPPTAVNEARALGLQARRLVIASGTGCAAAVSPAAAAVLTAHRCAAVLRATYLDSSGALVATVGVVVLPDARAASEVAGKLSARGNGMSFALRALPVAGTPASQFGDPQRQLAFAVSAGPYVILSTAGFTDGRRYVPLATDYYADQEMTSLADGLARAAGRLLGTRPAVPRCPGAPGC